MTENLLSNFIHFNFGKMKPILVVIFVSIFSLHVKSNSIIEANRMLEHAIKDGQPLEDVKTYVEKYGADVNAVYEGNLTPLIMAVKYNRYNISAYLIPQVKNINAEDEDNHRSALALAIMRGHLNTVKMLVDNNANVNEMGNKKDTALILAAQHDKFDICAYLIPKVQNIDAKNLNGKMALSWAILNDRLNLVKLLVENGASISEVNNLKQTPLILAAINARPAILEYLVKKKADVNAVDIHGHTPLNEAVRQRLLDSVILLLDNGADINGTGQKSHIPLITAIENYHYHIAKYLIKRKANLNLINNHNKTALFLAVEKGNFNLVKLLVENGADVNAAGQSTNIPIVVAAKKNNFKILEFLTEIGKADLNAQTDDDLTALEYAIQNGNMHAVKCLVGNGANVDAPEESKNVPILSAIGQMNYDIAEFLLKNGASVGAINGWGYTALDLTLKNNRHDLEKLLISYRARG